MNKKTTLIFLILIFVLPIFVSASPFWDLITGNAVSNSRPIAQITTTSLGYGRQPIQATVSDIDGDLVSAYIYIKSNFFRYRIYKQPMICSGSGYQKDCTYSVYLPKSWGKHIKVYVKGEDSYGYGRSTSKRYTLNHVINNARNTENSASCEDSDGGQVYNSKGTVTYNDNNYEDYCYSSTGLREYYCSNNIMQYVDYQCNQCENGACVGAATPASTLPPPSACEDSDGGKVYTVKGTVTYNDNNYVDYCYSSTGLKEYYCSDNNVRYVYYTCSQCANGACVDAGTSSLTPPPPSGCEDSDGGKVYYVKGTVTVNGKTFADYCVGKDLLEYYCLGSGEGYDSHYCDFGCEEGACVDPSLACNDSDGGKVYDVKGTATYNGNNYEDYCYSSTGLKEYYCSNHTMRYIAHDCSKCENGACVDVTHLCQDSDNGQYDYDTKGVVTYNGENYEDYCYSPTVLKEYYCFRDRMTYHYHKCNQCENGACLSLTPSSTCEDSDGGQVYNAKGTVTYNSNNYVDYCFSPTVLREYYCSNNIMQQVDHQCSQCENGACVDAANPPPPACEDSDGGNKPYTFGVINYNGKRRRDSCLSLKTLAEYYCTSSGMTKSYIYCKYGCSDGACNIPPQSPPVVQCNDSDGGYNYNVKGTVAYKGYNYVDRCSSPTLLIEYGCYNNALSIGYRKCNCVNGACEQTTCVKEGNTILDVPEPPSCCSGLSLIKPISPNNPNEIGICTAQCGDGYCNTSIESNNNCPSDCAPSSPVADNCVDSDGENYFIQGTVTYNGEDYVDYCYSPEGYSWGLSVIEYYCSPNGVAQTNHSCKWGCGHGKCYGDGPPSPPPTPPPPTSPPPSCKDSDGGKVYNVKGSASKGNLNLTDYCFTRNTLIEYYCNKSINYRIDEEVHQCDCFDGACQNYGIH